MSERFPPKDAEEVVILTKKPERAFEVMADFQSRGQSPRSLRREAADIGADAVIISTLGGSYSAFEEWAGEDRNAGSGDRITGTAIRYTDSER